jgi:hypothetical protein
VSTNFREVQIAHRDPDAFTVQLMSGAMGFDGDDWIPTLHYDPAIDLDEAPALEQLANNLANLWWADLAAAGRELFGTPTRDSTITLTYDAHPIVATVTSGW